MVWRQLPKLIPAGSIPVSRSKKDPRKILAPSHRRTQSMALRQRHMPRACRFGFEEPCALAAQTPVSCSFPQAHAKHGSTAAAHAPRLSVRVRRALRPRGANSRLLLLPTGARKAWLYGNGMSCACRFGLEEPCAPAAQTPVSCSFPQAHRRKLPSPAPSHRRTQSMALRQRHAPRLSVRVRRALRPRGANSRLLLVRVQSDYKITLQTATGKLSDLYVKSAPAISRGAFLIDFFLVMRRWKSDRCNGLHTS